MFWLFFELVHQFDKHRLGGRIFNKELPDLLPRCFYVLLCIFGQRLPAGVAAPCSRRIDFAALETLTGFDLRIRRFLGHLQPGTADQYCIHVI
jgi:hypothetical protein